MGKLDKVLIMSAEAPKFQVEAQFNPKELQVDKTVSWTPSSSHGEDPQQEFKEPQASSLSATLYFDTYESKEDVYDKYIKGLEKMVVMEPSLGRPPLVLSVRAWGTFGIRSQQRQGRFSFPLAIPRCGMRQRRQPRGGRQ